MTEGRPMISAVIPLYNEEENIPELCRRLVDVLDSMGARYEILFVDDGSTDGSYARLVEIKRENENIKIVKFRRNFGQTAAIHAGFDYAQGEIIATLDADLQNDPQDIPDMIMKLNDQDLDVVCGWRYQRRDKLHKKIMSRFANGLRRRLTGETIHDSGCTLRVYRKESVRDLDLYGEMHRYIPALLTWRGFRVGEHKVVHHERYRGQTKYNWRRLTRGFFDLMVVAFWQRYSFRPVHIFGILGFILAAVGGVIVAYLILEKFIFGAQLADRPLFISSILMAIMGVQFITTGILADIMVKIYYGQKERKNYLVENVV
ncbi:glycosyltransferase family 2 protein [Methanothrix sp.]|uniref:glycosyltransferase family 2 protein n=1 Tax=Methanothrix sp. TaxID=90426 RepID=UPI00316AD0A0